MRALRWIAAPAAVMTAAAVLALAGPAAAAPAGVCPAHPAQLAGQHVTGPSPGSDAFVCANLQGANLDGLDLIQVDMQYADLTGASLVGTKLGQADLTGAILSGANFADADLGQATMKGVTAVATSFVRADLTQAQVQKATLTSADFTNADLTQADLTDSDLSHATIAGADFTQTTMTRTTESGTHGHSKGTVDLSFKPGVLIVPIGALVLVLLIIVLARWRIRVGARRAFIAYPAFAGTPGAGMQDSPYPYPMAAPTMPVPYQPTVPDAPFWQPTTEQPGVVQPDSTSTSMMQAQNVIEQVDEKRWFGKDRS